MRKIIVSEMVSIDGFFADENNGIEWHIVGAEFNQYAINLLQTVDTILFGRVTYQLFESYWPAAAKDPATFQDDKTIAASINSAKKIVFSKTLNEVHWENVELKKEIDIVEIKKLKEESGKDIVVYGSGTIVDQLANNNLVDEYRLFIAPVVLGKGKPLFKDLAQTLKLQLVTTQVIDSQVVCLTYSS